MTDRPRPTPPAPADPSDEDLFNDPILAFLGALAEDAPCFVCGRGAAGADGRCAACIEFLE